jgi:acetamidase/formamidase
VTLHELPLERRTRHGHFSCELEPVLTVEPGDTIAVAVTDEGWLALGLGDDLDEAAGNATDAMLDGRELGLGRREALALASVVVDLRVTQMVNDIVGVHAVLPHGAIASERIQAWRTSSSCRISARA